MKEYIRNISKTNELILSETITDQEVDRLSKSDYRWAENRKKSFQTRKIKKGEVYQFEFGKNFVPEIIQRDSVMKLNDIRTVSVNRILYYQKDGRIDIDSKEYMKIEELVLNKYFPSFLYESRKNLRDREELQCKCEEQRNKIKELEARIVELKNTNSIEKQCG